MNSDIALKDLEFVRDDGSESSFMVIASAVVTESCVESKLKSRV